MSAVRTLVLGLAVLAGLTWAAVSQGQAPSSTPANPTPPKAAGAVFGVPQPGQNWGYARHDSSQQVAQLAQQYVKATKEDEKKEVRKKLAEALNQQFDERLQQQQKEIDDLEKQIASLKELLKKRQAAKTTIVERRIDQLVQDAEGLGWNSPGGVHSRNPYGGWSGGSQYAPGVPAPKTPTPSAR